MNIYCDYLFSIAYMQAAVSKLLEVQAKKFHILAKSELTITQMNEANERLKQQMKKIENIHLLLFNKFELITNSPEVNVAQETAKPETESVSEIQNQPEEPEQKKPQNEKQLKPQKEEQQKPQSIAKPSTYIFKGRGQGTVTNLKDPYINGLAIFQAYISGADFEHKKLFLSYSVMKGTKMLILLSSPENVKAEFILDSEHKAVRVEGTGTVIIKERSKPDITEKGSYTFNVRTNCDGQMTFETEIKSITDKLFIHQSGTIKSKASGIVIEPVKI